MGRVKIACESLESFCNEVLISEVVRPSALSDNRDYRFRTQPHGVPRPIGDYHPSAIVPAYPHRIDSYDRIMHIKQRLERPIEAETATALEIFKLREDESRAFMDYAEARNQSGREVEPQSRALKSLLGGISLQHFLGIDESNPDMLTTTLMDREQRLRHGLHLDDWGKLAYSIGELSQRRIALNLGPGSRYLVAAFPDAFDIAKDLSLPPDRRMRASSLVWPYADKDGWNLKSMRSFWFKLEPGEGYVAPTEVLVHDGSTLGEERYSRIAFWLGQWPVGIFPSKFEP